MAPLVLGTACHTLEVPWQAMGHVLVVTTDLVLSVTSSNPTAKLPGSVGSPGETLSLKESHDDRSPSLVDLEVDPGARGL